MAEASAAGIHPHLFWDYTFRELHAVMRGAALNAKRAHQLALFESYHVESFARTKRLPTLKSLLRKLEPARVMSRDAIRSVVLGMAEAMGAQVVRRKKRKD